MTKFYTGPGRDPQTNKTITQILDTSNLPWIRGKWFYVDPTSGSSAYGGRTQRTAYASLESGIDSLTSGAGDAIAVISAGTTSAGTTSYFDETQTLSAHNTKIVGISSGCSMFGRARVANKERTTGELTTISFADTDGVYTINDSAEGFVTAGFTVGSTVEVIANSGTNDGSYTVEAVAAGALTVTESVTTEDAATAGATTVKSYQANLLTISGDNNAMYNMHIANYGTSQYAVGGIEITGNRNYFYGCHFVGAGNATPGATTGAYDVKLNGAQEATFERCVFGTDSVLKAAANGEILVDGGCWRINFIDCLFVSYSATAGKVAVKSADASSFSGIMHFDSCSFLNWNENGISAIDDVCGGTAPTSGAYAVTPDSMSVGYTGWGEKVYVAGAAAAASAGGQIATAE